MNGTIRSYINAFRVAELQMCLQELGLSKKGLKAELQARLFAYFGEAFRGIPPAPAPPREQHRLDSAGEACLCHLHPSQIHAVFFASVDHHCKVECKALWLTIGVNCWLILQSHCAKGHYANFPGAPVAAARMITRVYCQMKGLPVSMELQPEHIPTAG